MSWISNTRLSETDMKQNTKKRKKKKENQIFCWNITPSLACKTWNLTSTCCNPHLAQVTDLNLDLWLLLQCQDQVLVLVTSVKIPKQFLRSLLNKCDGNNTVFPRTEWGKKKITILWLLSYSPLHPRALYSDNHIWLICLPSLFVSCFLLQHIYHNIRCYSLSGVAKFPKWQSPFS